MRCDGTFPGTTRQTMRCRRACATTTGSAPDLHTEVLHATSNPSLRDREAKDLMLHAVPLCVSQGRNQSSLRTPAGSASFVLLYPGMFRRSASSGLVPIRERPFSSSCRKIALFRFCVVVASC